jgi:hypothetical protein
MQFAATRHPARPDRDLRPVQKFDQLLGIRSEARVRYGDGEFTVMTPGDYVRCAVTGAAIPVASLKYWSVDLQEAYASPEASVRRVLERKRTGR